MTHQKPTVGRIVHYQSFGSPGGEYPSVPRPAIVTEVADETTGECHLAIFNPTGQFFQKVKYSETPKPGHWSWPMRMKVTENEK